VPGRRENAVNVSNPAATPPIDNITSLVNTSRVPF
jgi:hypothetical protein